MTHDTKPHFFHHLFGAAFLALWFSIASARANDATLYLSCSSLSVRPAQWVDRGATNGLALSAFNNGKINDELSFSVSENDPESHFANAYLTLPGHATPVQGGLFVGAPGLGDVNLDALTDFCEVALGNTNMETSGVIGVVDSAGEHDGTVTAIWNRAGGVTTGTVSFHIEIPDLGVDLGTTNSFEIYQYRGNLTYTATDKGVSASVELARLGASGEIRGPFPLFRTDLYDLNFPAGAWTNSDHAKLAFISSTTEGVSLSKGPLPTYYDGLISFRDGQPALGFGSGYEVWYLDLFDPNDANQNHIPDIVEPPIDLTPPAISITSDSNSLNLQVVGHTGQFVFVDLTTSLSPPAWTNLSSFSLTNPVQNLSLTLPASTNGFYRARL